MDVFAFGNHEKVAAYEPLLSHTAHNFSVNPGGAATVCDVLLLIGAAPKSAWRNVKGYKAIISLAAGVDDLREGGALPAVPIYRLLGAGMETRMAEYVLYATLHYHRNFDKFALNARKSEWLAMSCPPPEEFNVGVLGVGVMGSAVARRLRANNYKVRGWAQTAKNLDDIPVLPGADGFDEVVSKSDLIVSLLPLTEKTTDIFDASVFEKFKHGAAFVNCGRGQQVVDEDLIAVLDSDHLRGAMIDVVRQKPLDKNHPFWAHPKVVVTPHSSAKVDPALATRQALEILSALERGEIGPGLVNANEQY